MWNLEGKKCLVNQAIYLGANSTNQCGSGVSVERMKYVIGLNLFEIFNHRSIDIP